MREIICISVVLLGLAGREQVKSYIPTVAVATAAAEVQPLLSESTGLQLDPLATCRSGKCGVRRTQAAIKAGTTKMRTRTTNRRRLFRRALKIRRR